MKKKILILTILIFSIFLFCSCSGKNSQYSNAISTTFKVSGLDMAEQITVTVRENSSNKKVKLTVNKGKDTILDVEPGVYVIKKVVSEDKRVSVTLNEQYFSVNQGNRVISLTIGNEEKMSTIEWFLYNNTLYLLILVGCAIFLGIVNFKKEKSLGAK